MIDNTFNSFQLSTFKSQVNLNNLNFIFPIFATHKLSSEGTIQGDLTAMQAYAFGILPLIKFLHEFINVSKLNAKEVAFRDKVSVGGSLNSIKNYWDKLTATDPKYGYFPKATKSFLIVKENKLIKAQTLALILQE